MDLFRKIFGLIDLRAVGVLDGRCAESGVLGSCVRNAEICVTKFLDGALVSVD